MGLDGSGGDHWQQQQQQQQQSPSPSLAGLTIHRRRLRRARAPHAAFTSGGGDGGDSDSDSDGERKGAASAAAAPLLSTAATAVGPMDVYAQGGKGPRQAAARLHPLVPLTPASDASAAVLLQGRRLVLGERVGYYPPAAAGQTRWRLEGSLVVASDVIASPANSQLPFDAWLLVRIEERAAGVATAGPLQDGAIVELKVEEDGDDKLEEEEAELQALLVPASSFSSSSSTASSRLCKTLLGACLAADSSLHQTLLPHLHARSPHPLALLLLSRPQEGRGSLLTLADAEGNAVAPLSKLAQANIKDALGVSWAEVMQLNHGIYYRAYWSQGKPIPSACAYGMCRFAPKCRVNAACSRKHPGDPGFIPPQLVKCAICPANLIRHNCNYCHDHITGGNSIVQLLHPHGLQ